MSDTPEPTILMPLSAYRLLKAVAEDAASKVNIAGPQCPECGRDNREYGRLCTADNCPGVMAYKAANSDLVQVVLPKSCDNITIDFTVTEDGAKLT